jgi:hypothetical protein
VQGEVVALHAEAVRWLVKGLVKIRVHRIHHGVKPPRVTASAQTWATERVFSVFARVTYLPPCSK